ncbi:MAG: hypothetical protein JW882_06645 [Deltaproteobacteria bacterium]|nr:hypothetical protein [Deltaproteobacteria bacterium]
MKKTILQIVLLLLFVSLFLTGFFTLKQTLQLPFRATNDTLHNEESFFTLDFLIPAGTHIDENMTILEVIKIRTKVGRSLGDKVVQTFPKLVPVRYLYAANLFLFLFWSFLFMTFLRIFTFVGYGRALRISLFLGGCTYYFMPDFLSGIGDDIFFIGIAFLIIIIRAYYSQRKKKEG